MKRPRVLLLVALLAAVGSVVGWRHVLGPAPLGPPRPAPPGPLDGVPPESRAGFMRRLPEVRFENARLVDVMDFYRDATGANIFVNWRGLEAAGVSHFSTLTLALKDATFLDALLATFANVSGRTGDLGFTVDEGVITISSLDDLDRNTTTRVYDVRDLLGPATPAPSRQAAANALTTRLASEVAPNTWRDNGGKTGTLRELSGQLVVTQTPENQALLAWQLERMRWERRWATFLRRGGATVLAAVAVTAGGQWLLLRRRRRRDMLAAAGRCVGCGYDLRATPEQCPECGLAAGGGT